MKTAILAIILFCVMIYPHELGHYIAAKKLGVQVNEFSFGMGPVIWKKQRGETLHSIRLFPVGGFCAMEGEDGGEEEEYEGPTLNPESSELSTGPKEKEYNPRAFCNKKPWQKIVVLAAGSFMNVICAILIMIIVVFCLGFTTTTLGTISEGSAAEAAALQPADKVISIDDMAIDKWTDVSTAIQASNGEECIFKIKRNGEIMEISLTPETITGTDSNGNATVSYRVGIACKVSHNPFKAVVSGVQSTWNMTKTMFSSIAQLFKGEVGTDELTGPVGMVQMVSQTKSYGLWYFGFLTAMICLNLAIVNMLPLPALDGGRIIFAIYGWITGKAVNAKVEGVVHFVGLVLLIALMLYVTKNDIVRLIRG